MSSIFLDRSQLLEHERSPEEEAGHIDSAWNPVLCPSLTGDARPPSKLPWTKGSFPFQHCKNLGQKQALVQSSVAQTLTTCDWPSVLRCCFRGKGGEAKRESQGPRGCEDYQQ